MGFLTKKFNPIKMLNIFGKAAKYVDLIIYNVPK